MLVRVNHLGKIKNSQTAELIDYYQDLCSKKLNRISFELRELPDKSSGESYDPLVLLEGYDLPPASTFVLAEWGKTYTTPVFCTELSKWYENSEDIHFLVGNAFGWEQQYRQNPQGIRFISLSGMVFNHELAQVMLWEQIYRWVDGRIGGSYGK